MSYMGIDNTINFLTPLAIAGFLAGVGLATGRLLAFFRKTPTPRREISVEHKQMAIPPANIRASADSTPEFSSSFLHD